jgi:chorismate synthase
MSNGEKIVFRAIMKPIPTLMKPLRSVDMFTGKPAVTFKERSDVCALPAAGVVVENVCAFVLADEFLRRFGGDSLADIKKRYRP